MPHTIKLAFKDNPSGSDDFADLTSNSGNVGYFHINTDLGNPEYNAYYKRLTRVITIQIEARDTTYDLAIAKYRAIVRYLKATEYYFGKFQGNIPARTDGTWHQGHAAVLTYKNANATNLLYFNLFGGDAVAGDITNGVHNLSFIIPITITMLAEAGARGDRVYLQNLVACGGFEHPFSITTTGFSAGWTFTGAWTATLTSGANSSKFPAFIYSSANSATATSNAALSSAFLFTTGDIVIPQITLFLASYPVAGTITVTMEGWNGAAYFTQQTLATITTSSGITLNTWQTFTGSNYTVIGTTTRLRLKITAASNMGGIPIQATGAAIWRNPTNNTAPTEFLSDHQQQENASAYVYNVQGDVEAPALMEIQLWTTGVNHQAYIIGRETWKPLFETSVSGTTTTQDLPFLTMYLRASSSVTTASTLFWGILGTATAGAATSSTYNIVGFNSNTVDFRPRKYRAFLAYAANDANGSTAITAVTLNIATLNNTNFETKTWTANLPNTYTGNTVPVEGNYKLYMLGDYFYPRPGNPQMENASSNWSGGSQSNITVTHANNANRNMAILGIVLVPQEDFAIVDLGQGVTNYNGIILYGESQSFAAGAYIGGASPNFLTSPTFTLGLNSLNAGANYATNGINLEPNGAGSTVYTANRFAIITVNSRNSTDNNLLTYDATDAFSTIFRYSPRYLAVR